MIDCEFQNGLRLLETMQCGTENKVNDKMKEESQIGRLDSILQAEASKLSGANQNGLVWSKVGNQKKVHYSRYKCPIGKGCCGFSVDLSSKQTLM